MSLLSFLNRNEDQDYLAPFRQIILSLKNEEKDRELTLRSKAKTTTGQTIVNTDSETAGEVSFSLKSSQVRKVTTLRKLPLYKVKMLQEIQPLIDPLEKFYEDLYDDAHNISNSNVYNIGQKAHALVEKMDAFLYEPNINTLKQAQKAKNDFHSACTFTNKNTKVLCLVGAILCAAAMLLLAPPVGLGVTVALTTGAAMAGALGVKSLAEQNTIDQYIEVEKAINPLLGTPLISPSSPNRICSSKIDFAKRIAVSHHQLTDGLNEEEEEEEEEEKITPGFSLFRCCMS